MSSLKSSFPRALRSKPVVRASLVSCRVQRRLTATTKTTNATASTTTSASPSLFSLPAFHYNSPPPQTNPLPRTTLPDVTPFHTLLNEIFRSLTTTSSPHLPQLFALLRAYDSNPDHWSKYAHANPSKQYTRNLVCEVPGIFNLLLLVWTPGKASPIHDHADSHCIMKVLKGRIHETRFATPTSPGTEGPLVKTSELEFGLDKVTYMADALGLHSIENPHPTEYAASLHLYTPPNAAVRGCHVFDMESGEKKHVMQSAYDSVRGVVPLNDQ